MAITLNFLIGLLFGLGLVVGGMTNPAKVLNFLDFTGSFDPSLAFVMGGAVLVAAAGLRLAIARGRPLFASAFELPRRRDIESRLVGGAALFGIGWGLVGFCPAPAVSALATFEAGPAIFVAAMLAGMAGGRMVASRAPAGSSAPVPGE